MDYKVNNEYGKLKKIQVGGFNQLPRPEYGYEKIGEAKDFIEIIKNQGIEVVTWGSCWIRDPEYVIGDTYVRGVDNVMGEPPYTKNGNKIDVQYEIKPDGGDVIIHNDTLFVGRGADPVTPHYERNPKGLDFMKEFFAENWNIEPIELTKDINNRPIVHLDCVFNPLSPDTALIYPQGMTDKSFYTLESKFKNFILITGQEQRELGANVLSLGDKKVVSQTRHERINEQLLNHGFTPITTTYDYHASKEGAFRCTTRPIIREQ